MRPLFGLRQTARLPLEEAANRVLAGDLGVGEAARLTGRKKAEIALAVDHIIYRQSRIGLEDPNRRRRPDWWRRWPVAVAAAILAVEAAAALAVFHDNIRQLIVQPLPPLTAPAPRSAPRDSPAPAVPSLDKLLPAPRPPAPPTPTPVAPATVAAPAPRASPAPAPVQLRCPTEPGPRAALAVICRGTSGPFAAPDCECLR